MAAQSVWASKPRFKSRSPAPVLRTPTTPSQFFPPSYFAAAAGMTYPPNRDDDGAPTGQQDQTQDAYPFSSNASYLLGTEWSPRTDTRNTAPQGRARRKSQLGDLGLLESQLLPTLSDTVERMTRPPSQAMPMTTTIRPGPKPDPAPARGVGRTPSASSQSSSVYSVPSETHRDRASVATLPTPTVQPSSHRSPLNVSSLRTTPKSILKSHTLSDQHRLQVRQPRLEEVHLFADDPRNSSQSPIPILPEPSPLDNKRDHPRVPSTPPKPKTDGSLRTGRARSRTDPGVPPKCSPSKARGGNPSLMSSGIPRRVGVPPTPALPRVSAVAPASNSGADVGTLSQREKRRLFVTNAEITSSSSSESQAPLTRYVKLKALSRSDTQSSADSQLRPPRFGLGLGLSDIQEPIRSVKSPPSQRRATKVPGDESLLRHAKLPSSQRYPRDEIPKRRRSPSRNGRVDSTDGQRRQRELLSSVACDPNDSSGCDSQPGNSNASDDRCLISDGSGDSLRSVFDDSESEYSPAEDDGLTRSPRWEAKIEQTRFTTRQTRIRLPGDNEHVNEQCTPKASCDVSFTRQHQTHARRLPTPMFRDEGLFETESPTLASGDDVGPAGETVIQTTPERYSSELSRIMAISSAAAARQRQAFGISSSLDLEDHHQAGASTIPRADSDVSLIGGDMWQDECDELTMGSLLQQLDQNQQSATGKNSLSSVSTHFSVSQQSNYSTSNSPKRRPTGSIPTVREQQWKALERYVLESYGEAEVRRQRFIWELTESENGFVAQLENMIDLFILPLRVRDTRMWVSGIPSDAMKLFDWLDDIVRVHAQLASTLASRQVVDHPRLQMISEVFRSFVPRLETYQPYLVKLEFAASVIDGLIHERDNDFGEFIKLQEASERCQGWTLEQYLIEPVNRLAQYPEAFRRMLHLTPKSHRDYLSTFSLYHAAKLAIRVLSEVKDREDAYEFVKMACAGIKGIAPACLVHRDRHLLIRGSLTCVQVSNDDQATSAGVNNDDQPPLRADTPPQWTRRSDKLAKAVNVWRGRSNSVKSTASTVASFSTAPSTFDVHIAPLALGAPVVRVESEPVEVEVLVFTDIILFASRISPRGGGAATEMYETELVDGFGLSRVVSVLDEIDRRARITLDLAPLTAHDLEEAIAQSDGPVITISLSLARIDGDGNDGNGERTVPLGDWLDPLRRCCQYTLRASSSLTTTNALIRCANASGATEAQKPILSLLAAGLPLPKSPSMQLEESGRGGTSDSERQEREERGWWSARFHEVFTELSRQGLERPPK